MLAGVVGPLGGRRIAVDEQTGAMLRVGVLGGADVVDAAHVVGAAKLTKTSDELACIAEAQRRNERAMAAAQSRVRPGVTRSEWLAPSCPSSPWRRAANMIDPIFERMPRRVADGPRRRRAASPSRRAPPR